MQIPRLSCHLPGLGAVQEGSGPKRKGNCSSLWGSPSLSLAGSRTCFVTHLTTSQWTTEWYSIYCRRIQKRTWTWTQPGLEWSTSISYLPCLPQSSCIHHCWPAGSRLHDNNSSTWTRSGHQSNLILHESTWVRDSWFRWLRTPFIVHPLAGPTLTRSRVQSDSVPHHSRAGVLRESHTQQIIQPPSRVYQNVSPIIGHPSSQRYHSFGRSRRTTLRRLILMGINMLLVYGRRLL